jgi:hypothetical protein
MGYIGNPGAGFATAQSQPMYVNLSAFDDVAFTPKRSEIISSKDFQQPTRELDLACLGQTQGEDIITQRATGSPGLSRLLPTESSRSRVLDDHSKPTGKKESERKRSSFSSTDEDALKGDSESRWWTRSRQPLLCPLTNFPIKLLPYPPFKLRVDPAKPSPHKLVDGKFLAMQLIVNPRALTAIRELQASDVAALDEYVQRCKLGRFRPGLAMSLMQEISNASSSLEKDRLEKELEKFRSTARSELGKLKRIQENRLSQLQKEQHAESKPAPIKHVSSPSSKPVDIENDSSCLGLDFPPGLPVGSFRAFGQIPPGFDPIDVHFIAKLRL